MSRVIPVLLLCLIAALLPPPVAADTGAEVRQQVKTAALHAGFAVAAADTAQTRLHLHHALNCLVGEQGKDFDASAGNPCAGQGSGALVDLPSAGYGPDVAMLLEQARGLLGIGVGIENRDAAQSVAKAVQALLEEAAVRMEAHTGARGIQDVTS